LSVLFLSVLLTAAISSQAAERMQPAMMDDAQLAPYLPEGARMEVRLDADITGDGLRDLALVAYNDEVRVLKVMVAYASEVDMGYDPVGETAMEIDPLGTASLSVKKGVLLVEDLSGGTTAIQSLYRYRFDSKARRMRLIGDDVTLYSRTNAHDSTSISTNRLTGAQVVKRSVVGKDGYTDQPAQKKTVPAKPVYMEDAPTPSKTLGLGD
jgi:hypothetical protein